MSTYLRKIRLTNFKNYDFQEVECAPLLNCFTGLNGMGKTNLLDAIYYLCMGKSHFNVPDMNIVRHGADFFRLEGIFSIGGRKEKIVAKVAPRKKKELERNDVPYPRLSDHVGLIPVVFIAPDDTQLAMEGSEARRRFLDNTLSQVNATYLSQLILYNKILRQRNALLKQFVETRSYQPALLEIYDRQLLEPAQYLFDTRRAFLEKFRPVFRLTLEIIAGRQENADCEYQSQLFDRPFADLLAASREKDRVLERTTTGPHKDDLAFSLDGLPLKRFGSQGQLKSFILALKLAQYDWLQQEKKQPPLLLLDDLFDRLDRQRVRHLLALLLQRPFGQIFITDTDPDRVEEIIRNFDQNYRKFKVENGRVVAE